MQIALNRLSRSPLTLLCLTSLVFLLLGCNVSQLVPLSQATPTPTRAPIPVATATPEPTETFTPAPTLTPLPKPTDTPTVVSVPLATAVLTAKDLPEGFQPLSAADLKQFSLSEDALARPFGGSGSQIKAQNLATFWNQKNFEIILTFLLHPLSPAEKTAFDAQLSNPDALTNLFVQGIGGTATTSKPGLIPGADKLGDKSVGITMVTTTGGLLLRADVIVASRGNTVEMVMVFYQETKSPAISAVDVTKILDAKVKNVLGIK
jgi:hypothetical protein